MEHVNQMSADWLQSPRIEDTETVAAVFINRQAQDIIDIRNRRFLAASVDEFAPLLLLAERALFVTAPIFHQDALCSQNSSREKSMLEG